MRVRVIADFGLSDGQGHRYRTGEVAELGDELAAAWLAEGYVVEVDADAKHWFDEFGRVLGDEVAVDPTSKARIPADQLPDLVAPDRPPAAGKGSGRDAWAAYAENVGIVVDSAWSKSDIVAAVDQAEAAAPVVDAVPVDVDNDPGEGGDGAAAGQP